MNSELSEQQQTVLRLCCEAASSDDLLYWEGWFSAKAVLSRYATQENRREGEIVEVLQSLMNQGYVVLPPTERTEEAAATRTALPAACQVTGLGFEKYAEATFERYLDWVEAVSAVMASSELLSPTAIAERLEIDPAVVVHILHYHQLV